MSFLRPPVDPNNIIEAPIPMPIEGGRTRMAGERPSRARRKRPEEIESSIEEAFERRGRGRGRRGRRRVGGSRRRRGPDQGAPQKGTVKGLRFIGTPPPGYEFDENDRIVKRGGGGRTRVKGPRPERPEGMPPKGPSKGTKYVTMRDPETGYKYGGKVVDGVPQFTKPDFSDRKPLPGYPKKETDRPRGPREPKTGGFMQGVAEAVFDIATKGATGSGAGLGIEPPTGGRGPRRDPRPNEDRNRGRSRGVRGRRKVRDEAFERRRSMGSKRKRNRERDSKRREERRRRVRNANTPMIK